MFAIKINNRLVRDDRGCVYKYSSRGVAEMKGRLFVRQILNKEFKVVEI